MANQAEMETIFTDDAKAVSALIAITSANWLGQYEKACPK
jgi:hypothetical protein